MVRETELFFDEVLKHDLSLTNFVASDFTMLNGRLAKHYGIPGVEGWEFRKVTLPPDSHRGGVLTMASVLKVTANGTNLAGHPRGLGAGPHPGHASAPAARDVRGPRAGHPRRDDDPRTVGQAPADRRRARAATRRSIRRDLRWRASTSSAAGGTTTGPAGNGKTGDRGRPADALPARAEGGPRRRDAGRPEVPEYRRVQATAPEGQGPARPRPDDEAADLRHGRGTRRRPISRRSTRSSARSATRITACGRSIHEIVQSELFQTK